MRIPPVLALLTISVCLCQATWRVREACAATREYYRAREESQRLDREWQKFRMEKVP